MRACVKTRHALSQPDHVSWKLDAQTLVHRVQGQRMEWMAWDGPKNRTFAPPVKPMHMTMSLVGAVDQATLRGEKERAATAAHWLAVQPGAGRSRGGPDSLCR